QCGPEVSGRTARILSDPDVPAASWQSALAPAMAGRPLLVEGLDLLRGSGPEWDSGGLFAPAFDALRAWLSQGAAILSRPGARTFEPSPRRDERFSTSWIRERVEHDADLQVAFALEYDIRTSYIWERVEHDAERYALAVARELLLGPIDLYEAG